MTWLRHLGRAFLTAVMWGVVWAPLGVLTGALWDPNDSMDEPWIALGAYPGFFCGLVFCALLALADRRRRLADVSPRRACAWGALGGLLLIALPMTGLLGTVNTEHPFWRWRFALVAAVVLLSAVSAIGSVLLARKADNRAVRDGASGAA